MEKTKKNLKPYILIYIIFGLGLLLAVSIICNIYFYARSRSRIFDCNLSEKIELEFTDGNSVIIGNIVYPSNIVSGTKYDQQVILKTGEIKAKYFVRAKLVYADYNIVNESIDVSISPSSQWQKNNLDYYYLNSPISTFQEIEFINSLTLPQLDTTVKNNTIITILFEFLETTQDVQSIWGVPATLFEG